MSGMNPINNSVGKVPSGATTARVQAAPDEPAALPQDSVVTTGSATPPADSGTSVITMRVEVKNELLQPDPTTGKSKLDELEPDFVAPEKKSPNAPVVLAALGDPEVPEGYTPVSTVALVPNETAADPNFQTTHFPTFVAKDGYVLSQAEVDNFAKQQQDVGFQKGLGEGVEKGRKEAVPPGFQPKLMDSEKGKKIEAKRDQFATIASMIGSTSGALGISAGIGIPAQYAAPLALAAAPLAILGPTGTLSNMAKLENQKAALLESVKAEHPDEDPMKVTVDMNPFTQTGVTTEEALHNLDMMKTTQKMKTVGSVLLAGAGVAALGGFGTAATMLAVGSLASPLADTIPTFDKIGEVHKRKKELGAMLQAHEKAVADAEAAGRPAPEMPTVEIQVPVLDESGQPVGVQPKQIPVTEALENVKKSQKTLILGALGTAAQAGSLIAMGLGAPIMMVVVASAAVPLLARGALFPKESWETIKGIPGALWDVAKRIGNAIKRKLGFGKDEGGGSKAASEMSESQQQLFKTLGDISKKDAKLAEGLQETLNILSHPPSTEEEQKAAIEAGPRHQAQLQELREKYPELADRFDANMKTLIEEGAAEVEQQQFEAAHEQVEQVVQSPFAQELLGSERVRAVTKGDQELGERVVRMMAQAQIFGSSEVYEELLKTQDTDKDAAQQVAVYKALEAELQARAQQGQQTPPGANAA